MCVYILLVSPSQGIFSSLQSELTVSCEGFSLLACYKKAVEKMRKLRAPSASCRLGRRPSSGLTVSCGWLPSPALALAPFAGRSRLLVPLVRGVLVPGALSRPPVGIGGKLKGEAGIQGPDTSAPATNFLRPSGGCRSAKAVD